MKYYEHKTDSYKNKKRKLAKVSGNELTVLEPYNNHPNYGFNNGATKPVDEETLNKYWKELTRGEFFEKEVTHIPTPLT